MTQDALFSQETAAPATGALVVAATDGSARPNPKVKSHTTLTTSEHVLNREADARAGAVVEALQAGTAPDTGPGWTGHRVARSLSSPSTGRTSGTKP